MVLPWFILISLITLIAVLTKVINLELCSWYQRVTLAVLIGFSPGLQAFVMVSIAGLLFSRASRSHFEDVFVEMTSVIFEPVGELFSKF